MSEIGVYIGLKRDHLLPGVLTTAIRSALVGYFTPHSAALNQASKGRSNPFQFTRLGGFEPSIAPERTFEEVTGDCFRLLPAEVADEQNCWTTVDLPECGGSLDELVLAAFTQPLGWLSIHGNLRLLLRGPGGNVEPHWLFRELMPVQGSWSPYGAAVTIDQQRYLPVTHLSLRILAIPSQPDYATLSITASSHVWLEYQDAFRGLARATAVQNTEILAGKVRDLVIALGDHVEDVSLATIERKEFGNEVSRIVPTFMNTVPGMTL